MVGKGPQSETIILSHDLLIVRPGHYKGQTESANALNNAYGILMEAFPGKKN